MLKPGVEPAHRTLILLHEPGVDALLVMHVHARQQPHFFTFGERQQTNTEADSRVTAAITAALQRREEKQLEEHAHLHCEFSLVERGATSLG